MKEIKDTNISKGFIINYLSNYELVDLIYQTTNILYSLTDLS